MTRPPWPMPGPGPPAFRSTSSQTRPNSMRYVASSSASGARTGRARPSRPSCCGRWPRRAATWAARSRTTNWSGPASGCSPRPPTGHCTATSPGYRRRLRPQRRVRAQAAPAGVGAAAGRAGCRGRSTRWSAATRTSTWPSSAARRPSTCRTSTATMDDDINGGDDTDRLLVRWPLAAAEVGPLRGRAQECGLRPRRGRRGAVVGLDVCARGRPVRGQAEGEPSWSRCRPTSSTACAATRRAPRPGGRHYGTCSAG